MPLGAEFCGRRTSEYHWSLYKGSGAKALGPAAGDVPYKLVPHITPPRDQNKNYEPHIF